MEFLQFLAQYRTPAGNILFQGITYLAQEIFVVAVICWMYWCSNKRFAYSLGFTYFTSGLLIQGFKITFRIPRPWVLNPDFHAVPSALPGATGYSFPSGHTQSITALFRHCRRISEENRRKDFVLSFDICSHVLPHVPGLPYTKGCMCFLCCHYGLCSTELLFLPYKGKSEWKRRDHRRTYGRSMSAALYICGRSGKKQNH